MIKYFHQLTKQEFAALPKTMTYADIARDYPQPAWCKYPHALNGEMGCWSLMMFLVTTEHGCSSCECFRATT